MGRKSRIETELSPEDLAEFRRILSEGRLTIDDLVEWLDARGYDISRSAVARTAQKEAIIGARLRQSRAIMESLTRDFGAAAIEGQQGRLLVEVVRGLVFEVLSRLDNNEDIDPKLIVQLAKALEALSRAARLDQDFEEKVEVRAKKLAAEMAAEKAAEMVDRAGSSAGLSADTIARLKADFLGMG